MAAVEGVVVAAARRRRRLSCAALGVVKHRAWFVLAELSYGLYLTHFFAVVAATDMVVPALVGERRVPPAAPLAIVFALSTLGGLGMALLLRVVCERPLLSLRRCAWGGGLLRRPR